MTCTADSDYIRAVSVKYKRCPSSYSVRSAVARTGFEIKPLQRPKTAQQTVPSCAQPRAQTARAQREKTRVLEELMFFYGRGVHDSVALTRPGQTARGSFRDVGNRQHFHHRQDSAPRPGRTMQQHNPIRFRVTLVLPE
ncbi:hypothetical protein ACOMHN_054986 [Nucella lapillus]